MRVYQAISADIWELFKKWVSIVPRTSKEWDRCEDEFDAVVDKYPAYHEYAHNYAMTCINEIERIWKETKKNGDCT